VSSRAEKHAAERLFGGAFLAAYNQWGHESVTGLASDARPYDRLSRDLFVIDEPAECIDRIEAYADIGVAHIACLMNFGKPDLALVDGSMRLFGEKVIPHFS
jgi:alkanesulfonate monooxygenase SsuD/methylene tetrahydromethanopterin reductase-like flavin-dependent oxidoreductase (luciferase family)